VNSTPCCPQARGRRYLGALLRMQAVFTMCCQTAMTVGLLSSAQAAHACRWAVSNPRHHCRYGALARAAGSVALNQSRHYVRAFQYSHRGMSPLQEGLSMDTLPALRGPGSPVRVDGEEGPLALQPVHALPSAGAKYDVTVSVEATRGRAEETWRRVV
jgi:hypothetical protein